MPDYGLTCHQAGAQSYARSVREQAERKSALAFAAFGPPMAVTILRMLSTGYYFSVHRAL